jgi:hypothetical protein
MRRIAKDLMVYETAQNKSSEANNPAGFHAINKLRPHLATLMGNGGFQALLSRALVLTNGEISWLRDIQVNADGTLEGLEAIHGRLDPAQFLEGRVVLLAHLLGLLVSFIGPDLTARIVGDIWPKTPLNGVDFGTGGTSGTTK